MKELNQLGCECYVSYAEDVYKLNIGKFDVILLGDIIEHIPNPSTLLISLRMLLESNGILICTTPNALSYSNILFITFNHQLSRLQHVAWYCTITLTNLFKSSGYSLVEMHFCNFVKTSKNPMRKILDYLFSKIRPELSPQILGIYRLSESFNQKEIQKQRHFYQ